jgi:hypothetical protein
VIALDFETAYDGQYSVKALGPWRYCHDPRFRLLLCAAHSPDFRQVAAPGAFDWRALHGRQIVAHNAGFDRAVFKRARELGICPADVEPAGWLDTAAACAYLGLPRDLAGAVRELFGVAIDKSVRDRMAGAQPDLFDNTAGYAAGDSYWAWRIWERVGPHWPESERRLLELTHAMGDYGVRIDVTAARTAAADLAAVVASLEASTPFRPIASKPALDAACAAAGVARPPGTRTGDPAVEQWCRIYNGHDAARWVRNVQAWRRANRTRAVVDSMLDRIDPATGRMVYDLRYFGAVPTGRWSGSGGLNVQNFNRQDGAGVNLRGLIVPEPGHVFVIADYAQIEARVLLWLAGDREFLEQLRGGMDLYEAAARKMLGYADPRPLKAVDPGLRQLAKGMTLGLGFGMGARKFVSAAKILAGLDLSFDDCKRHVSTFRRTNPRITDYWQALAEAFQRRAGKAYYRHGLPSGRPLHYWEPVCDGEMECAQVKGGERIRLHPGLLAENAVQATARDILAAAWIRCVDAGHIPVLSVHDELVFEVPEAGAQHAAAAIQQIMQAPPPWPDADALPLQVETAIARRYGK